MESPAEKGVGTGKGEVFAGEPENRDTSHLIACPHTTVACLMERALHLGVENENVEVLLLGLWAAVLCYLLVYGIAILAKFQVGIFALILG